ncbi:MAG: broad specificity phosphatase PhoE [Patiriisocius sp.]|jgi:broad specificity phosphatase PhoE
MTGHHLMFVRHGETVGNIEQIAHGQSESPLNDRGKQQVAFTAEMLTNWETPYHRVYASPMSRAHDTGLKISEALGLPIHLHEGLKEGFLGDWEGITYKQLSDFEFAKKSIMDDNFKGHNGESPNQLANRMFKAINEIRADHADENIIIVSHGAAIAHALSLLLGTKPMFGHKYIMHNSAVTEISLQPEPNIVRLNYHEHIPNELKVDPTKQTAS